jgi:Hg(II)-responsive transcriptional regulator
MEQNTFTIGELAKQAKLNTQTIRYYERRRLLLPSERSASGYRFYTSAELKRILFIKNAQDLGFTLKEIQELLSLRTKSSLSCGSVQKKAEKKLEDIRDKMRALNKMERVLVELVSDCKSKNLSSSCPILDKMEDA